VALDGCRAALDTGYNAIQSILVAPAAPASVQYHTEVVFDGKGVTSLQKSDVTLCVCSEIVSKEGSIADRDTRESTLPSPILSEVPPVLFHSSSELSDVSGKKESKQARWQMGILNDSHSSEVPGMKKEPPPPSSSKKPC
jgi:hypothetical protein